ncbi:MAG: hypothetical protein DMF71_16875, partial [Acidobacteria bacterium]
LRDLRKLGVQIQAIAISGMSNINIALVLIFTVRMTTSSIARQIRRRDLIHRVREHPRTHTVLAPMTQLVTPPSGIANGTVLRVPCSRIITRILLLVVLPMPQIMAKIVVFAVRRITIAALAAIGTMHCAIVSRKRLNRATAASTIIPRVRLLNAALAIVT